MLLINPPVTIPSEPPPGLAKLAGALRDHRMPFRLIDANLEGIVTLLREGQRSAPASMPCDTWTRRAFRHLGGGLETIRAERAWENPGKYQGAVMDINRSLAKSVLQGEADLSLANYRDVRLSPLRSGDLLRAAETPEDNPFYPYFSTRLLPLLSEGLAAVGFSLNYLSQALCTFAMIGYLKRAQPHLPVILGGGLVTSWMRRPGWQNPFVGLIDKMIAGPGEDGLLSFLGNRCREEHHTPFYGGFPLPDYLSPGFVLPYSTSQGCYWQRCSFCPEAAEGNPYRPLAPEMVTADLRKLVSLTKPVLIHFLDNALHPAVLAALIGTPPGVPWYGFVRITRHLTDPDFCRALREAGCIMLQVGLESGDQGVLESLRKGVEIEEASRALKTVKEAGIAAYVYLLFGTPSETAVEARKTLDFTVQHHNHIAFLNLAVFNLPAHGAEAQTLPTSPFYEGELSLYRHFVHPRGWERRLVKRFLDREFKRHPAVSPILRRDPPIFGSSHAPFFVMAPGSGVFTRPSETK